MRSTTSGVRRVSRWRSEDDKGGGKRGGVYMHGDTGVGADWEISCC